MTETCLTTGAMLHGMSKAQQSIHVEAHIADAALSLPHSKQTVTVTSQAQL